jgi:hypothetical protein
MLAQYLITVLSTYKINDVVEEMSLAHSRAHPPNMIGVNYVDVEVVCKVCLVSSTGSLRHKGFLTVAWLIVDKHPQFSWLEAPLLFTNSARLTADPA